MQWIFLLNFVHINKCLFKLKINEISLKLLNLNRNLINKPTEWYGNGDGKGNSDGKGNGNGKGNGSASGKLKIFMIFKDYHYHYY